MSSNKSVDITVVGSIFMDLICYADRLPKPGETLGGTDFQAGYGGKGANQCISAQRLGAKTAFVGKLGKDAYGKQYYENFVSEGVSVEGIVFEEDVPTGVASIMVGNDNGENFIVIVEGATKLVSPSYVKETGEALIASSKIVVCQLEIPPESSLTALRLAKEKRVRTIFNPAPAVSGLPEEIFRQTDILILNETEAEIISGMEKIIDQAGAEAAIEKLRKLGCTNVILTLGADGALLWDNSLKSYQRFQAPKVKAVDTTGAGDCFVGTFAFCISRGDELSTALRKAIANASDSVQRKGTQKSFPSKILLDD
jgi:ribokinase